MSGQYLGDYHGDETVYIYFDSFDSDGASVTLTGLALADIKVYKNASMTERSSTSGFALIDTDGIDIDSLTGIHGVSIDISDNADAGFFAAGNDYTVVIDSVTIDTQTVRFVAARFSIQNRSHVMPTDARRTLDVTATGAAGIDWGNVENLTAANNLTNTTVANLTNLPSIPNNWITAAGVNAGALNGKGDWNIGKSGYSLTQAFPANFGSLVINGAGSVDSLVQGFLNTGIAETTAGRIADNFDIFFDNADALTTKVVDDVGGGAGGSSDWTASEKNEIRGRLGITGTTAAGGNTPTLALETTLDAVQTSINNLNDIAATDIVNGGPIDTTAGSIDNVTLVDTTTTNTDMRGTDGANTTVPPSSGSIADAVLDELISGHLGAGSLGSFISDTLTAAQDIQSRVPAALISGRMDSNMSAIAGNSNSATSLSASASTIVIGAATSTTLSTTQMSTALTEDTDDHFNGRIIIWTSGALKDQATDITDYNGTTKTLTFTATTEAPADSDTFVIV